MNIINIRDFQIGRLEDAALSLKDRAALSAMANEETAEELADMLAEADSLAEPAVLFGVCPVETRESVQIGKLPVDVPLVEEKLRGKSRCFPYVATCGAALENWSRQFKGDFLTEFWAEEIKKRYLQNLSAAFFAHIRECYHTGGYLTAVNPGSLKGWPVSGQRELFALLGGRDFVEQAIGVRYTDSFLMLPTKSISGIAFESKVFYENCQYCPLVRCPNRRAAPKAGEENL